MKTHEENDRSSVPGSRCGSYSLGCGVTGEGGPLAFQRADAGGLGTEVFVEGNSTMHFTKGAVSLPPCP